MATAPTISVIMAVYNGAKYLDQAVQSIRGQTFGDFEFIIIDDGSTDGSSEILLQHAMEDPRIRILRQDNRGLVASLNRGCAEARGRFIARMDADDVSLPDRFEKQLRFLQAHPTVAVLGGAAQYIEDGRLVDQFLRPPTRHREIMEVLSRGNPVVHGSIVMKRDAFKAVGGYRRAFVAAEDADLWWRLGERCELANLEDVIVHLTKHTNEVSFARAGQQALSGLAARYAAEVRRRTKQDPCENISHITPRCLMSIGVPPSEIEAALLYSPPHRVNVLLHRGACDEARQILNELSRFLAEFPSSRRSRSRIAYLRSKTYRVQHRFWHRMLWVIWACLLDPNRIRDKAVALARPPSPTRCGTTEA